MIALPLALLWLRVVLDNGFGAQRVGVTVPLLGGLAGCLALLACPLAGSSLWAWLPPLFDVGSNPLLVTLLGRRAARSG